MSYSRDTFRFFYAPTFLEFNSEHFSQPGVRPKFQEVVRFMKSILFDPAPTDPTDTYADKEGGLRFDSTQHKFKYRDNVNWKYFGTGDGDVKYDDQGTNGVAKAQYQLPRWSARTGGNYIDSSRVTISDIDVVETPQTFISTNGGTGAQYGFLVRRISAGIPTWAIANDGTMWWNQDTSMFRDAAGSLTFNTANARLYLSDTGNTRVAARSFLGGLGTNTSVNYGFRCPVTMAMYGFYGIAANTRDSTIYSVNIGNNTLAADNDRIEAKFHISTTSSGNTKTLKIRLNGANEVSIAIPGSTAYDVMITLWIYRETGSSVKYVISGLGQGLTLGAASSTAGGAGSIDWTATQAINVLLDVANATFSANEIIHRNASWTLYNQP